RVVEIVADGMSEDEALRIAAAVEHDSEHPVGRAIVLSAQERALDVADVTSFRALPGHGVEAQVDGTAYRAGGPNLLRRLGAEPSVTITTAAARFAERGQSTIYLLEESTPRAVFAIADQVRPESLDAVQRLQAEDIEVVMLTGDAQAV